MPQFASKKQYRMMMAIMHGKAGSTARGDSGPPKSVAEKYSGSGDDGPESKGKEHHGGKWDDDKKAKHGKKKVEKTDSVGVGVIVVNDRGQLLMGRHCTDNSWSFPGGGVNSGEGFSAAAVRELKEETGLDIEISKLQLLDTKETNKTYVVHLKETPTVHSTSELYDVGFYDIDNVDLTKLRHCCGPSLKTYLETKLTKGRRSLKNVAHLEKLQKNILRTGQVANAVYELTHGDSLRLVGNGTFRILKKQLDGMGDDEVREIKFGHYTLHVRKHANDIYSGRIDDGLKTIHQFTNRSVPGLTGELMSVFEWYSPEQDSEFTPDETLPEEIIDSGIGKMVHNYRSYNIADIYDEMESIREEIRHGNAVDLQQAEQKIMTIFDSLEDKLSTGNGKHESISQELELLQSKLVSLQSKVDEMSKQPQKIEAYSSNPANPNEVLGDFYPYLSKPKIIVHPSGHIVMDFNSDWSGDDKSNFLKDMRAKALKDQK